MALAARLGISTLVLWAVPAGAMPTLYTISDSLPFGGLGISGTLDPVGANEAQTFGFSGAGEIPGADVGEHVCNNASTANPGFFESCSSTTDDVLVYSVTLEANSVGAGGVSPFLEGTVNSTIAWSGYIRGDGSSHDPDGSIFTSGGRGVVFLNFADPNDTSFYLQANETSSPLLTAWSASPGLSADLAGGASMSFGIFRGDGDGGGQFDVGPVTVVPVPEPSGPLPVATAIGALLLAGRARWNRGPRLVALLLAQRPERRLIA